jgi:AcrR family transcriptional regulator
MDPRVSRTRAAVLRTATELFVEGGPTAVTIDAIVARSGVAKSTIYRHWESRDDVLLAVIESCAPTLPVPDPDTDVVTALRDTLRAMAGFLNDPEWARMIPALLLLKHHEAGIAELEERLEQQQDQVLSDLVRRAADEGLIEGDVDVEEAIASLVGPLLFAHLTGTVEVDDGLADRTIERFLAGHRR